MTAADENAVTIGGVEHWAAAGSLFRKLSDLRRAPVRECGTNLQTRAAGALRNW